jgi:hypothetical protein
MHSQALDLSHSEFVDEYRAGRVTLSYDVGVAFDLKTRISRTSEVIWMLLAPSAMHVSVLAILAAILLRDWWVLLGVPIAWIGMATSSASQHPGSRPIACLPNFLALGGFLFGLWQGWPSLALLLALAYWISHEGTNLVYRIAKKSYVRKVLADEKFYELALEHNHITVLPNTS